MLPCFLPFLPLHRLCLQWHYRGYYQHDAVRFCCSTKFLSFPRQLEVILWKAAFLRRILWEQVLLISRDLVKHYQCSIPFEWRISIRSKHHRVLQHRFSPCRLILIQLLALLSTLDLKVQDNLLIYRLA